VQTNRIELETHCTLLKANNLGEYARLSSHLLRNRGWDAMVCALCANDNLQPMVWKISHPAAHVLDHLRRHGAPMITRTPPGHACTVMMLWHEAHTSPPTNTCPFWNKKC